jgi:hypothetical protein
MIFLLRKPVRDVRTPPAPSLKKEGVLFPSLFKEGYGEVVLRVW